MIELFSLPKKFTASVSTRLERDVGADDGLLGARAPLPKWQRRPHLSLSSFPPKRAIFITCAILLALYSGRLLWSNHNRIEAPKQAEGSWSGDPHELVWGTSRDWNRREVFWWEQFPMLNHYYFGVDALVPSSEYSPEQDGGGKPSEAGVKVIASKPVKPYPVNDQVSCFLDTDQLVLPPTVDALPAMPRGMPRALLGSHKEVGLNEDMCYDRVRRFGVYGFGYETDADGLGIGLDDLPIQPKMTIDYGKVNWGQAQRRCQERNALRPRPRTAFVIRTWHTIPYDPYRIMMLRAIISELSLGSGGDYEVHFLIHVQDDDIPIWASEEVYNETLRNALPPEFEGMGTLWSIAQMKLIYPGKFEEYINFGGGPLISAYRSLHFPFQYFASQHPEYDYFWHWEMDVRVTGHYYELLDRVTKWAEQQPKKNSWERSSRFFLPKLYGDSYSAFGKDVLDDVLFANKTAVTGPQLPTSSLLPIPSHQSTITGPEDITDLITINPIFDPARSRWAFRDDIIGYGLHLDDPASTSKRRQLPTRASLITTTRFSRRLLLLMHEETFRNHHTMFPEMFPTSVAFQYGLKVIHAPIPVYHDRDWPSDHANIIFNNAPNYTTAAAGGDPYFQDGEGGSVFGPGEHVFRGVTYYSNAGFGPSLWRRWLGKFENGEGGLEWERGEGETNAERMGRGWGTGRMCLPMMVIHPVKHE